MNKLFIISCSRGYCNKIQSLLLKLSSRPLSYLSVLLFIIIVTIIIIINIINIITLF